LPSIEVHVTAGAPRSSLFFFSRLRSLGRRLARFRHLSPLKPLARSVIATAEPPGRLLVSDKPATPGDSRCGVITVVSANLWHDWPRHRQLSKRLETFARLIEAEHADIVLLQEVSRTSHFQVDEWLERRLGMAYVYTRANGHQHGIGFEEGLAIFSRFPLSELHLQQLGKGRNPFVRRLALGAVVETPCGSLVAFSAHLGLAPRQNMHQLNHLWEWVAKIAGGNPALIGGDFNAHEHKPQITRLKQSWLDTFRHVNTLADGTTHEIRWPWGHVLHRQRLDYIFLHQPTPAWEVLETRHLHVPDNPHSDHRAVLTRLAPLQSAS
jgi:endonuclease/exonuclease/phosphatase family metal-dependent hydrolase